MFSSSACLFFLSLFIYLTLEIDENTRVRREKHLELTKGISFYSTHLGLTFERFEDKSGQLRFTFTQIDPKDPNRPFYFIIRVIDDSYEGMNVLVVVVVLCFFVLLTNHSARLPAAHQGNARTRQDCESQQRSHRLGPLCSCKLSCTCTINEIYAVGEGPQV